MTEREAALVEALKAASKLLDRAADWIDKEPAGIRGPAEELAHTRIINALDAGMENISRAIARAHTAAEGERPDA